MEKERLLRIPHRASTGPQQSLLYRPVDTCYHSAEGALFMIKKQVDFAAYLAVRTVIAVIQAVSIEMCERAADLIAYVLTYWIPVRRRVVDDNLRHVFPQKTVAERQKMTQAMWKHLFLMICEIAHIPRKVHETNWRDHVFIRGLPHLTTPLLAPRATVMVSGHYGNFEFAGHVTGLLGFPAYAIARPLDNPYLHQYVNRFRAAHGQYILPKQGSAEDVQRVLDSDGTLTVLGDQHAGPKGCWTDFLGRPASCHKALALFSLTNDAPMVVTYCRRIRPMRFELGFQGAFDPRTSPAELHSVRSLTAWYNRQLEDMILTVPEQYWWVHRRWKGEPPKRKKRTAAARKAA